MEFKVTYPTGKKAQEVAKQQDELFEATSNLILATGAKTTEGVVLDRSSDEVWGITDGD